MSDREGAEEIDPKKIDKKYTDLLDLWFADRQKFFAGLQKNYHLINKAEKATSFLKSLTEKEKKAVKEMKKEADLYKNIIKLLALWLNDKEKILANIPKYYPLISVAEEKVQYLNERQKEILEEIRQAANLHFGATELPQSAPDDTEGAYDGGITIEEEVDLEDGENPKGEDMEIDDAGSVIEGPGEDIDFDEIPKSPSPDDKRHGVIKLKDKPPSFVVKKSTTQKK